MALNFGLHRSAILVTICFTLVSLTQSLEQDIATNRQLDSSVCIARRYCTAEAAATALMTELSITAAEAKEVTDYTHNTSDIEWMSCSCDVNCAASNNCCPDASTQLMLEVPESLKEVTLGCDFYNWNVVPVVESCPEKLDDIIDESVRTLCEQGESGDELVKVTSSKSYVTYTNIYCGMCHGESMSQLQPWSYHALCVNINSDVEETSGNGSLSDIISNSQCTVDISAPQVPPKDLTEKISTIYGVLLSTLWSQDAMCTYFDDVIETCPPGTAMDLNSQCTQGLTSYVTTDANSSLIYRNADCAVCNDVARGDMVCQACSATGCMTGTEKDNGLFATFSILVQPYPSGDEQACQAESDDYECTGELAEVPACNEGEYLDTKTMTCEALCPPNTVLFKGLCVIREIVSTTICDEQVTYGEYLETGKLNSYRNSMYNNNNFYMELNSGTVVCHACTRTLRTANDEGLTIYQNGSAKLETTLVDGLFISRVDNSTYLCFPESESTSVVDDEVSVIARYQDILTLVLCLISIIFLILFFVAFSLVKRMRNIPGSTIAGSMLMFLLAYISFLARGFITLDATVCYVVAVLLNYFFISAFVFMIIYAMLIIKSLEFVDLDSRYTVVNVALIWLGGILIPFIAILPAIFLDFFIPDSVWSPGYGGDHCFMSHREGNILFFTLPIALCLLISICIYVVVVLRLIRIAAATSRVRDSHREKIYLCVKLIIVLGFNWLTAILAAAVSREKYRVASEVLSTIFIIFCCLHGFFAFIVFVISGSNIQLLKARYSKLSDSSTSTGGKATRTYSGQPASTTVTSEMSTMIHKSSLKHSPVSVSKFSNGVEQVASEYCTTQDTIDLSIGEKSNASPLSNRSNNSKKVCDFF